MAEADPMLTSFGQWSGEALRVLFGARHELARVGGQEVTPEHLLLALLAPTAGSARAALDGRGVPVLTLRQTLEDALGTQPQRTDVENAPLAPDTKAILDRAQAGEGSKVGSRAILAALIAHGSTAAARFLREHGVDALTP